jgi:hypothetical protein
MQITHLSNVILRLSEQIGSPASELSLPVSFSHSMDVDPKNREETISKLSEIASFAGINLIKRKISRSDYRFLLKGDFPPHLVIQADCQVKLFYRKLDQLVVYGFPGGIKSIQAVHSPEEILAGLDEDLDELEIFTAIPIRGLFGDSSPGAHPLVKFFKLLFRASSIFII